MLENMFCRFSAFFFRKAPISGEKEALDNIIYVNYRARQAAIVCRMKIYKTLI
jgi:hypothetical protein